VTLGTDPQRLIGLETARLASVRHSPVFVAYGRLLEDPSETFVVRAPLLGVLRPVGGTPWPHVGQQVRDGETVFAIDPLIAPIDRLTLESQAGRGARNCRQPMPPWPRRGRPTSAPGL
jgi:hypothetical protein